MKVQGRLMQARLIEIHHVFAKNRSDTFLTELYIVNMFASEETTVDMH